jgi:Putative Flp pilus-assembly TadE/G-like
VRTDREAGSTLPLILVFFLIALSFVAVAVGATALHLERLRLLTLADGAALAGAESFRVADVQVQGDQVVPALAASAVGAEVRRYLDDADPAAFDGLTVLRATTTDGRAATVTLAALWHPPIVSELLPVTLPIEVTSTAAARFR